MITEIAIVSNLRMLLIFLLLTSNKIENIFFIFDNSVKNNSIEIKIKNKIFMKKNKDLIKIIFSKIENLYIFTKIKKNIKFNSKIKVYGADHINGADFFLKRNSFYLIEDGNVNYSTKISTRSLKNIIFSIPKYGKYKNVKKIYLTGLAPIPKEIENKVEIINLQELWNKKTLDEQIEILEIFDFNEKIIQDIKKREIIIFTQPLSEDGIVSKQEKIELYSKIILKYPKEKIVLKLHPRETTNYKEIFKGILVLEQSFPAEIFELLNIEFERAVTLFSTAAFGIKVKYIDFYGTEVNSKLFEKMGNHDFVMKRNAFLDKE